VPNLADRPRTSEADMIERSTTNTGGLLWGPDVDEMGSTIGELEALRLAISRQVDLGANPHPSIALVDWTSLHHAKLLLEQPDEIRDPFTALANFASVIAAVLFYDRVLVISDTSGANDALGVGDLIRPVPVSLPGVPEETFPALLDRHYWWARDQLLPESMGHQPPDWLTGLAENWNDLLPGTPFPEHRIDSYQDATFRTSSMRGDWQAVVFQRESEWTLTGDVTKVIVDNDLRALVYERLAATLQAMLRDESRQPSVQYVGGCLRAPLLLARAQAAEAALLPAHTPENWLQQSWQQLFQRQSREVQVPFWLQAVLAASRERQEIAPTLIKLRRAGSAYRKHRQELANAVTLQDRPALQSVFSALAGDVQALNHTAQEVAAGALAVSKATLKIAAPVVPSELIGEAAQAAASQSGWLNTLGVRLFRPRLWLLVQLTRSAQHGSNILPHAAHLFGFAGVDAREPSAFLNRIGRTTWIA